MSDELVIKLKKYYHITGWDFLGDRNNINVYYDYLDDFNDYEDAHWFTFKISKTEKINYIITEKQMTIRHLLFDFDSEKIDINIKYFYGNSASSIDEMFDIIINNKLK